MSITGIHPYADQFPMLADDELAELAESIRTNGLRQPVVITDEGLILDGRNRAKACEIVGIEPETVVYDGDDLAEYVIDCNVTRRNMSTGARAMSTALVLQADGRRENGRWRRGTVLGNDESVITDGAWQQRLKECGAILDFKPDLAPAVVAGALALDAAYQQAKAIKDSAERDKIMERERRRREADEAKAEAERNAQIVADLTVAESQYLPDVDSGRMTPKAAWAAHLADTEKERKRQREIEHGWRTTTVNIAERVRGLSGGAQYAETYLREFHPHADRFVPEAMQLTHANTQDAIDFLTAVQKGLRR